MTKILLLLVSLQVSIAKISIAEEANDGELGIEELFSISQLVVTGHFESPVGGSLYYSGEFFVDEVLKGSEPAKETIVVRYMNTKKRSDVWSQKLILFLRKSDVIEGFDSLLQHHGPFFVATKENLRTIDSLGKASQEN